MTNIETAARAALYELKTWGPRTCTEIGEALYALERKPGHPIRRRQSYARPGGRVLRWMQRRGWVRLVRRGRRSAFATTGKAEAEAEGRKKEAPNA